MNEIKEINYTCPYCSKTTFNIANDDSPDEFKNLVCSGCGKDLSYPLQEIMRLMHDYNNIAKNLEQYEEIIDIRFD